MREDSLKKVLFLDVDGVLNNGVWASEMYEQGVRVYDDHILEERALDLLKRILYATDARVVISSSWRNDIEAYRKLKDQLFNHGVWTFGRTGGGDTDRGEDIRLYLEQHPSIEHFAILDDDNDVGEYADHLIQTDPDKGLTGAETLRCIRLLNEAEIECHAPLPHTMPQPEEYYAETAIYIRTVDKRDRQPEKGSWRLSEGINAEVEIRRLTAYALSQGYTNLVFYVDGGYEGHGTSAPASMLLHRRVLSGYVGTVIISAENQIEGGMNILMMTEQLYRKNGVRLIIAGHDQEAGTVIRKNYDAWVWESIGEGIDSLDTEKGIPADEVRREIEDAQEEHWREYKQDLEKAHQSDPIFTKDGYRLINADEALWLIKTNYGE